MKKSTGKELTAWLDEFLNFHSMSRFLMPIALLTAFFSFLSYSQPALNYVETHIKQVDGSNDVISRSYSDGLGKKLQSVVQINATGALMQYNSIINGSVYDDAGRADTVVKPFGYFNTVDPLGFVTGSIVTTANNYYSGAAGQPDAQGYAFSSTSFYADPLDRVKSSGAPGQPYSEDGSPLKTWYFGSPGPLLSPPNGITCDGFLAYSELTVSNLNAGPAALASVSSPSYFLHVTEDANGYFTQVLEDKFGDTVRTWSKSSNFDVPTNESVNRLSYDILGHLVRDSVPSTMCSAATPNSIVTHYNALGQVTSKTTPDGHTIFYSYLDNGKLYSTTDSNSLAPESDRFGLRQVNAYDKIGRPIRIADSSISDNTIRTRVRTIYDDPQNAVPFLTASNINAATLASITQNLSNTRGRVVAAISYGNGIPASLTDDVEKNYANKVITVYSYDDEGRVNTKYISIPDMPLQTIAYTYDLQSKVTKEIASSAGGRSIETDFAYDANGRLSTIRRDNKLAVSYCYDYLGKISSKIFSGSNTANTDNVYYDYTIRDWTGKIRDSKGKFTEDLSSSSCYDLNGNILQADYQVAAPSIASPVNDNETYGYDNMNRLSWCSASINGVDYTCAYDYFNDGRIASKKEGTKTGPEQAWGNYDYFDGTNKLAGIEGSARNDNKTYPDGTSSKVGNPESPNYIYDFNGNLIYDKSKKMRISYDWRDLPIRFTFYDISQTVSVVTMADVENLDSKQGVTVHADVNMLYDASGNRVKKETVDYTKFNSPGQNNGTSGLQIVAEDGTPITIGSDGSLSAAYSHSIPDPVPSGAFIMNYDLGSSSKRTVFNTDGSIDFKCTNNSNTFENQGSLVYEYNDVPVMSMGENGSINVPYKFTSGVAYVEGKYIYTSDGSADPYAVSYALIAAEGKEEFSTSGPIFKFYLKDHLGSTRAVWSPDLNGNVEAMSYLPYGTEISLGTPTPDQVTREKFTGKELDQDGKDETDPNKKVTGIGLSYFGKRYYDNEIGEWIGIDPKQEYFSPYCYVGNNPIYYLDPNGEGSLGFYFGVSGTSTNGTSGGAGCALVLNTDLASWSPNKIIYIQTNQRAGMKSGAGGHIDLAVQYSKENPSEGKTTGGYAEITVPVPTDPGLTVTVTRSANDKSTEPTNTYSIGPGEELSAGGGIEKVQTFSLKTFFNWLFSSPDNSSSDNSNDNGN